MNKVYVGNLPYSVAENTLDELFSAHGKVTNVRIIMDRETGRSKGFAFVEFDGAAGAEAAINNLNGYELEGRTIKVNMAQERQAGGGGGGRRSGGGGNY